jgi:hypothetical protein
MLFRQQDFPNLHAGNHRDTSPPALTYNCIAWAASHDDEWWDPTTSADPEKKFYWPANVPRDYKLTSLIAAYVAVGFATCADGSLEDGSDKIAIYADGPEYTHAALQLETGKWSSKIGELEDIEHDTPDDLAGPAFGNVALYMKRQRPENVQR